MTLPRVTTAAAALVAGLAVALAGCTSGGSPESGPTGSASGSVPASSAGSASTTAPPAPPAPKADACYRLTLKQLAKPTNDSTPVSCSRSHDTQTVFVGRLDTVVAGHAVAVDSRTVQRQLETTCPARLRSYLGGSAQDLDLSRLHVVWFSPTLAQADQGADWFRCDVIGFGRGDALYRLPPPRRLRGALGRASGLSSYGLCGTAAPGERGFERVICALRHSWRAFTTIPLSGGAKYPGVAAVRNRGDDTCKSRARARSGNSLKYEYGWEWPTRPQWNGGQHYGYCWAPD